jgi:hypothetical protein
VVTKDLPELSRQIANAFGEVAVARERGAAEAEVWPPIERLAVSFENRFYGKTATAVRVIGREVVAAPLGQH